jgi:polysaccharide export outer membrane protein
MKKLLPFLAFAMFFASCVPHKKILYVQSAAEKTEYEYAVASKKSVKIEPFDVLYISILSGSDHPGFNFFNQDKMNFNSLTEASLAVLSYSVNDSGNIILPVVGKIRMQGLTLNEAAATIKKATQKEIIDPVVTVKFVNSSVTVLGEVAKPGTYAYQNEKLNVFFALGLAGDISEYGNRKKVVLIRESNNAVHKYTLDLTTDDIFKSDYYYLRPNDVLYVEPLKIRRFGMKEYPFTLVVSAVTSAFLVLYYVKK